MEKEFQVGFIGAGKMATALAQGLLKAQVLTTEEMIASDPDARAREAFTKAVGVRVVPDNAEVIQRAQIIILAVKPSLVVPVLESAKSKFSPDQLVISIAAGVKLAQIESVLGDRQRIIRVMPNTAVFVGAGVSAYSPNTAALLQDIALVEKYFSAVGMVIRVPEPLMDVVTGLSGSGPAYVCTFIEALADGAVAMGMAKDVALKLAAHTVLGSAKWVIESGAHPAVLRDTVTSPGGTTIAGIRALEEGAFRGTVINAVMAATQRAKELSGA